MLNHRDNLPQFSVEMFRIQELLTSRESNKLTYKLGIETNFTVVSLFFFST